MIRLELTSVSVSRNSTILSSGLVVALVSRLHIMNSAGLTSVAVSILDSIVNSVIRKFSIKENKLRRGICERNKYPVRKYAGGNK